MVNAKGVSTFVKFHWRPVLGSFSLVWDEAVKLGGADPDFHRRDLFEAIEAGAFPEYELAVQAFDQETADGFDFDVLDPTKLIPEEVIPLTVLGKMVLDRNVDNFFAETEQVAFCVANVVPGIDFTNDPLMQGRLFSYLDTQLKRLGGPNFHEIPVNRPKCPWHTLQRDGHMRHEVDAGRVAYEPNSLDPSGPREDPQHGFTSVAAEESGEKLRVRSRSFADHYTQARLFWISMREPEQQHIVNGFAFELGKVETEGIRKRMLGHLEQIDGGLAGQVAQALGMDGEAERITPAIPARKQLDPSPALSLLAKTPKTLNGRKIGVLVTDGVDARLLAALRERAQSEGARLAVVAPRIAGVTARDGKAIKAQHALSSAPSVLFDAVVIAPSESGVADLLREAAAVDWLRDAFGHLKVIGHVPAAAPLFEKAAIDPRADTGLVSLEGKGVEAFLAAAKLHRIWDREPQVRTPG
jgi:catalase